jgi:hypothetical protein
MNLCIDGGAADGEFSSHDLHPLSKCRNGILA